MGVFDDKKFEQLDWMTQITETIDSELNALLVKLPDRTAVKPEQILENLGTYSSLSVSSFIEPLIRQGFEGEMAWEEKQKIYNCFKFEVDENLEVDATTGGMTGKVYLVKVVATLEDKDLQDMMGSRGIEALSRANWGSEPPLVRMNEMLDLVGGCEEAMRNRSANKKMRALASRLRHIFLTNEWRIRDMVLANKVGFWLKGYIADGNLSDLTNITKLKVMTHNNMPIYSVKEE